MSQPILNDEENEEISTIDVQATQDETESATQPQVTIEQDTQAFVGSDDSTDVEITSPQAVKDRKLDVRKKKAAKETDDVIVPECEKHKLDKLCGEHTHMEGDEAMPCYNKPWNRIHLKEASLSRKQLNVKRFTVAFRRNRYFSVHYLLQAFHRNGINLLEPLKEKLPYKMIIAILNNAEQLSYQCMTVCDCELLRKMAILFFGIDLEKVNGDSKTVTLTLPIDGKLDKYYFKLDTFIGQKLENRSIKHFAKEHMIKFKCPNCDNDQDIAAKSTTEDEESDGALEFAKRIRFTTY